MTDTITLKPRNGFPCYIYDLGPMPTTPVAHLLCEGRGMRFYVTSHGNMPALIKIGEAYASEYRAKGLYFFIVDSSGSHFLSGGLSDLKREFPLTVH